MKKRRRRKGILKARGLIVYNNKPPFPLRLPLRFEKKCDLSLLNRVSRLLLASLKMMYILARKFNVEYQAINLYQANAVDLKMTGKYHEKKAIS